jgi:D-glycero-beta-D-manno-heptose-7-phosphate kinase
MTILKELFEQFNKLNVLIVGDVMIDSYLWGSVNRISPEAPVPIVSVNEREKRLGGAANVALNIKAMGATPYLVSIIGDDADGVEFENILKEEGIPTEGLVKSKDRITTIKHRIIASSQHILRVDSEEDQALNHTEKNALVDKVKSLISECDVLIFEDYDKGVLTTASIQEITQLAQDNNVPIVVDPKKRNFLTYTHVDCFKPNLKELKEGTKSDFNNKDIEAIKASVAKLKANQSHKGLMVTLSELGVYIDKEEKTHIPAHDRKIADVSGAGDTVISVAALAIATKQKASVVAALSNLAGGLVCEFVGVVPVDKQQLLKEAEFLVHSGQLTV